MCLNVYRSKENIPKGMQVIDVNDTFFNAFTELSRTPLVEEILLSIDKAVYTSPLTFEGRTKTLGNLNKSFLSTGTKTLLNIISNPNICFDVCECGNNVLYFLSKIAYGNILWESPVVICAENTSCNICVDDKEFTDFYAFLDYCYEK